MCYNLVIIPKLIKLSEILTNSQIYSGKFALYCFGTSPYDLETNCAVFNPTQTDEENFMPNWATENNLQFVVRMENLKMILENVRKQKKEKDENNLLQALNYYLDNNCFLLFP